VVGAPNGAAALQKIAMSRVVVIAEGYATASTLAEHGKVPTLVAYDSGNLFSVATSIRERRPDKAIVIAGDDDHRLENNPGRERRRRPWPALPSSQTSAQNSAAGD
jgi:putative DNA primase/helicase